jgi:hypothetical protein
MAQASPFTVDDRRLGAVAEGGGDGAGGAIAFAAGTWDAERCAA